MCKLFSTKVQKSQHWMNVSLIVANENNNKKAVLPQGNCAKPKKSCSREVFTYVVLGKLYMTNVLFSLAYLFCGFIYIFVLGNSTHMVS